MRRTCGQVQVRAHLACLAVERPDMGNWLELIGSAFWVLGLAACLAALSMARYQTRVRDDTILSRLARPGMRTTLATGACLICIGLVFTSNSWLEKGIWSLGAVVLVVCAAHSWRGRRATREEGQ